MPILYVVGGVVSARAARLPVRRAAQAGGVLVSWQGCAQISLFLVAPRRGGEAARRVHGARLRGRADRARQGCSARSSASSTALCGVPLDDEKREMTWTTYAVAMLALQRRRHRRRLRHPAAAGRPAAQPATAMRRGLAGPVVEHRRQLRHEHELAELRRRDDDELPHADARRSRCRTSSPPRRAWPSWWRSSAASRARRRPRLGNFWVDLDAEHALHPAAALDRPRARPRLAGRRADVRRVRSTVALLAGDEGRRRQAPSPSRCSRVGPGRLAGGDQAARHERRRLLQRQLGAPVREPDAALELRRDARRSS